MTKSAGSAFIGTAEVELALAGSAAGAAAGVAAASAAAIRTPTMRHPPIARPAPGEVTSRTRLSILFRAPWTRLARGEETPLHALHASDPPARYLERMVT